MRRGDRTRTPDALPLPLPDSSLRARIACRALSVHIIEIAYSFGSGWLNAISTYPSSGLLVLYICEKIRLNIALWADQCQHQVWEGGEEEGEDSHEGGGGRRLEGEADERDDEACGS